MSLRDLFRRVCLLAPKPNTLTILAHEICESRDLAQLPANHDSAQQVLRTIARAVNAGYHIGNTFAAFVAALTNENEFDATSIVPDHELLGLLLEVERLVEPSPFD